jgi:hypothetical protein
VATVACAAAPAAPTVNAQAPGSDLALCAEGVRFIGFSDALNKTAFGGLDVKELSAIAYDEHNGLYYTLADRDKATPTHFFTLSIPVGSDAMGTPTVLAVTQLRNGGIPYNGYTFDGEGIAVSHNNQLFAASESGSAAGQQPEIRRFSLDGVEAEALAVPDRFLIGTNNLSFESLALSPSGRSLFTANERSLPAVGGYPADGRTDDLRNRIRILRYEDRGPAGFVPAQQYFYLTEPDRVASPDDVGVVDLIALSETDLLVLERGFLATEGNTVRIFRVSLAGAADVSGEPTLAAPGLAPLAKTLLVDLAGCPAGEATIPPGAVQPNALLDNFEDMTLGPYLPGGWRALILQSDDNFGSNQTTRLVALAIPVAPF